MEAATVPLWSIAIKIVGSFHQRQQGQNHKHAQVDNHDGHPPSRGQNKPALQPARGVFSGTAFQTLHKHPETACRPVE